MRVLSGQLTLAAAISLCLTSCEAPAPRTAAYNPAEYASYAKPGTGKITGQVFLKTVGGDVKYGAGNAVWLYPVTSMTTEWYEKEIVGGHPLQAADERIMQYSRKVVADGTGNFEFSDLPSGDYYLVSHVAWEVPAGQILTVTTGGVVHAKVHAVSGKSQRVMLTQES